MPRLTRRQALQSLLQAGCALPLLGLRGRGANAGDDHARRRGPIVSRRRLRSDSLGSAARAVDADPS